MLSTQALPGRYPTPVQPAQVPNLCCCLLQADKHHILAAVISCSPTAQGGRYLQRHLQRELHHQLKQNGGNAQAALPATLRALDEAFRDMHPFNGHVCEGVKLTLAYIDAKTNVRPTACVSSLQTLKNVQACLSALAVSAMKCCKAQSTVLGWELCLLIPGSHWKFS